MFVDKLLAIAHDITAHMRVQLCMKMASSSEKDCCSLKLNSLAGGIYCNTQVINEGRRTILPRFLAYLKERPLSAGITNRDFPLSNKPEDVVGLVTRTTRCSKHRGA